MARKRTQLPKARVYLRPMMVSHQAGAAVPGRGQLRRVPFQGERPLGRLKIRELPDGTIEIPNFVFDPKTNGLVQRGKSTFSTINDALRSMGWHIPQRVREETGRMHRLYNQLGEFHGITADRWKRMDEKQRQLLMRKVTLALGKLSENPSLLRSETKIKARDRIVRAAELLKKGNQMAALLSLSGAANDALQRFNELLGQRPFLSRRERSMLSFKTEREHRIFMGLRELAGQIGMAGRLSGMRPADRVRFVRTVQNWQRYFGSPQRAKITAFREAGEQLQLAIKNSQSGKFSAAVEPIRRADRLIIWEVSKHADLWPDLIQSVGQSRDNRFKKAVIHNQAQLVADNIGYWAEKGFPTGFGRVAEEDKGPETHAFFTEWARAAQNSGMQAAAREFVRARTAFNTQNIPDCRAALEKIAELCA